MPPAICAWPVFGLSPRGQGNRKGHSPAIECTRSIPAWAGEPIVAAAAPVGEWVYPRVGGGTFAYALTSYNPPGLSPRGRGNPLLSHRIKDRYGSIPAWAGEPWSLAGMRVND